MKKKNGFTNLELLTQKSPYIGNTSSNLTAGELDLMFGMSEVKIGWLLLLVGLGISQHQQYKYKGGKAAGLSHPVAATKF